MCLTVIFRDYVNYSRECINMILKPAWKLLNFHLPVFTEVLCYNQSLVALLKQGEELEEEEERGFESDDEEETYGVEGMT